MGGAFRTLVEMRNAYNIFVGKPYVKRQMHKQEDNIKMDLK
jgi:hypothetical protein